MNLPIPRHTCRKEVRDALWHYALRTPGLEAGWERNRYGRLLRGRAALAHRAAVWAKMRADPRGFSYPEIGAACSCSHATVLEALRRVGVYVPLGSGRRWRPPQQT